MGTIGKAADLLRFFYAQRVRGFDPPGDEPYMDPASAERFRHELSQARRYLEYGSGGTTVVADRAGIAAVSVENDRFFARAVARRLQGGRVRQLVIDTGITREWGFPLLPSVQRARSYVSAPFPLAPFPDFILIDGRWRVACALESARAAHECRRSAVVMIDDYAGRPHYRTVETWLGDPEMAGRSAIFRIGERAVPQEAMLDALRDPR